MGEINATKQNIEKRMKKNEDSLRDLWDNFKNTNIHIIGGPRRGRERERTTTSKFEEIITENFPNMGKKMVNQVQEVQSPIQDKPKERDIVIKLTKIKDKDKLLKQRGKRQTTYKGNPIKLSADFSIETLQARRE